MLAAVGPVLPAMAVCGRRSEDWRASLKVLRGSDLDWLFRHEVYTIILIFLCVEGRMIGCFLTTLEYLAT